MHPRSEMDNGTTPAVTWLIAAHIANDHLKTAIESCLNQTFRDFECLVIANGADATIVAEQVTTWFGSDDRLRVITTDVRHLNFSLSLGLHLARGPLIARMDADDISLPNRLEHQLSFMSTNPLVAVLGTQYEVIDQAGQVIAAVDLPTTDLAIRKRLYFGNPFCHPSVMLRRGVILEAGGYLGGLHAEDYDLWARLARSENIKFANLPTCLLQYRSAGIGVARRARSAYATMGAAQFANCVAGAGWPWGIAALISLSKAMIRGQR